MAAGLMKRSFIAGHDRGSLLDKQHDVAVLQLGFLDIGCKGQEAKTGCTATQAVKMVRAIGGGYLGEGHKALRQLVCQRQQRFAAHQGLQLRHPIQSKHIHRPTVAPCQPH